MQPRDLETNQSGPALAKVRLFDPIDDLDYLHRFSIVKGVAVAVGTGTHKHIARNAAATDALKSLGEANNHG